MLGVINTNFYMSYGNLLQNADQKALLDSRCCKNFGIFHNHNMLNSLFTVFQNKGFSVWLGLVYLLLTQLSQHL